MARPSGRSRLPWYLGVIILAAAAAYALYPVGGVVEGMGVLEPVFEDLVLVRPDRSGIVTRMRVRRRQEVERGTPLFEYLGDGQWSVLAHGSMSGPGGAVDQTPAEPEWTRAITQRRLARAEALRHWSARVFAHGGEPRMWERLFEQRLNVRVSQEDELALSEARAAENARLGRHDANLVHAFDQSLGVIRATEDGAPFSSEVEGLVYSLWVMQRSQFFPAPVGEIMKPGTEVEVLGLVPIPPKAVRAAPGWTAGVAAAVESATAFEVTSVELGRIPLDARDAQVLFPDLGVTRDSVFVRLALRSLLSRDDLGKLVRITLTAPARPRLWLWLDRG